MAVRLDQLPPLATRPGAPRIGLWLALLAVFMVLGMALTWVYGAPALRESVADFFGLALGAPLFFWTCLVLFRSSFYFGSHHVADGWDEAREEDRIAQMHRGRRCLQVFDTSLYTALHTPDEVKGAGQMKAFEKGSGAFKVQTPWQGEMPVGHSRLPLAADDPEDALEQVLTHVLADLSRTLAALPDDTPLALLLEIDTDIADNNVLARWHQAWAVSGIRQPVTALQGTGLSVLDHWLDQRITDQALLMVVAVQLMPAQAQGTAEAAVGLLLGNRSIQTHVVPAAYLHRPEQELESIAEPLHYATQQALDWVPLPADAIERVWRVGVDARRHADLAQAFTALAMPAGERCSDVDGLLGHPGKVSPWLGIAAAAQATAAGAGPQCVVSGGCTTAGALWATVLMPAPALAA